MSFEQVLGQSAVIDYLESALNHDRLPHALLMVGPSGTGKSLTASCLATRLLCEQDRACGQCPACQKLGAGTHPDYFEIGPEAGQSNITLDQLRSVFRSLARRSLEGHGHVVSIRDAHRLRNEAQDFLLKTLEEPPDGATLILSTDEEQRLRPTVRSRCHQVRFTALDDGVLREIASASGLEVPADFPLGLARGQVDLLHDLVEGDLLTVRASLVEWLRGPRRTAVHFAAVIREWAAEGGEGEVDRERERERVRRALSLWATLARDVVVLNLGADPSSLVHGDRVSELEGIVGLHDIDDLDEFLSMIARARGALFVNISPSLVLEKLALEFRDRFAG